MRKPLALAQSIPEFSHIRPTMAVLERITLRNNGSKYQTYQRSSNSRTMLHYAENKRTPELNFLEPIFEICQEVGIIVETQICDVFQAVRNQGIISQPQIISCNLPQAICVHLSLLAEYEGHVNISRLVVAKVSA